MKNKDYYIWNIKTVSGDVLVKGEDKVDFDNIYGPCTFELIPRGLLLKRFRLSLISEDQRLIYFRRVIGRFDTRLRKNIIDNIIYFLGYEREDYKEVIAIDIKNKKEDIIKGNNITL